MRFDALRIYFFLKHLHRLIPATNDKLAECTQNPLPILKPRNSRKLICGRWILHYDVCTPDQRGKEFASPVHISFFVFKLPQVGGRESFLSVVHHLASGLQQLRPRKLLPQNVGEPGGCVADFRNVRVFSNVVRTNFRSQRLRRPFTVRHCRSRWCTV